jgi:hypothetical protein
MAVAGKNDHSEKLPTKSKKSLGNVRTTRSTARTKSSSRKASTRKIVPKTHHKEGSDATYIFECTRPGCGYRIPREEKAELGSIRFDLKCPKCHHREFKCLGKGDLPESFELSALTTNIDFNNIRPVDLGSN